MEAVRRHMAQEIETRMNAAAIRPRFRTLVTLLLVSLILTGCSLLPAGRMSGAPQVGEEPTPTPIPTPVTVSKPAYTVARGKVTKQLIIGGRIVPVTAKELFFRTTGRVRAVFVKNDDMVKAGQLLAELEMANLERDLAGSRLELERAQARLKTAETELKQNIKRAQANLDIAKENLAIIKAQDPAPRKKAAEVALEKADLVRQQAQAAYDKIAWRPDRGASPEAAALQQATLNYTAAQSAYDLALQEIATHGHQVSIAVRQMDLAQIGLESLKAGVDPLLDNDVKRAQLAVDKLQAAISDAQIVAPIDGQVQLAFILSEGAAVDAFKYVATVSDLTALEAHAETVNVALDQVSVGMPALVALIARPGVEINGRVRQMPATGTLAAGGQNNDLRIALDAGGADAGYASGDVIRITIVLEQKPDTLWLPPAAIRTFEGRKFVVVQENAGQRRVDVNLGIESEDRVEIASGLTEGQIVVGQ
jgi:multidrug efflux pump subunit AcrA (membrane-fusion protein)